jgi:hypothetical protein
MAGVWLYQMSEKTWPAAQYRAEIWEGGTVYWPSRQIRAKGATPEPGDRLLCWYARTDAEAPGLCGWGVVLGFNDDREEIIWRPAAPADALKMRPLFDADLTARVDAIRGKFRQATMWQLDPDDAVYLLDRVRTSPTATDVGSAV